MADLTSGGAGVPGFLYPNVMTALSNLVMPALTSITALSALDTAIHMCGQVIWQDGGTHNIQKVGILPGSVTPGTGTTFKVALQNISATSGPPARGDGTDDQSVSTTTMPTSATWTDYTLGSVRSAASGDFLAVVLSLPVFGAGTVVRINTHSAGYNNKYLFPHMCQFDGGTTYTVNTTTPIVMFTSDDATPVYGTLDGCIAITSVNTHTFGNTSNPKEYCCVITPPIDMVIDGLWAQVGNVAAGEDFSLTLRAADGTEIDLVAFDSNNVSDAGYIRVVLLHLGQTRTLSAGVTYLVGLRPDTSGTIVGSSVDVPTAEAMNLITGGENCTYTTISSTDVVAAATTTRRFAAGVHVVGVTTAAASGGMSPIYTGME